MIIAGVRIVLSFLVLAIPCASSAAQPGTRVQEIHDAVTRTIKNLADRELPAGDTLLTWAPEPTLFHTVAIGTDRVSSGLLRPDGMIGVAETRWAGTNPASFGVRWTSKGLPALEVTGKLMGDSIIRISGSRDTSIAVPRGIWAVADFGMEEHLLPLVRRLSAAQRLQTVSVLRPYHLRWDTLRVTIQLVGPFRVASVWSGTKEHELITVSSSGALLWVHRTDVPSDRHPLEGSARYAEYLDALPVFERLLAAYRK